MTKQSRDISSLSQALGVAFKDQSLLKLALTHRSYSKKHNERLEHLGDAVLGMIIAHQLYLQFPNAKEGQLSRLRSYLVCGDRLSEIAREFNLGRYLYLGQGEIKERGADRTSTLADTMEAIIGAYYLDAGMHACEAMVKRWYQSRLTHLDLEQQHKDAKTLLQEYAQSKRWSLPEYKVVSTTGLAHEQQFTVECRLLDAGLTDQAKGMSIRSAEQAAARKVLQALK